VWAVFSCGLKITEHACWILGSLSLILVFFQDVGNYVDLWLNKPLLVEIQVMNCGPKRTQSDICGCMNKTFTEICVNRIPEQDISIATAEYTWNTIHSEEQTSCCEVLVSQGEKLQLSFQMFESCQ
jgi:hypothetical protein